MAKLFNQNKFNVYNPTNVFKGLHCIDAGYYDCDSIKEKGIIGITKHYYTLLIIIEGNGVVTFNDKTFSAQNGNLFIIPPCANFSSKIDKGECYKFFYINFEGEDIKAYFELNDKIKLGEKLSSVLFDKLTFAFTRFLMENKQDSVTEEKFNRLFFELLENITAEKVEKGDEESYISKIVSLIKDNYENPAFNVNTISEKMHLSHSWLCALFKKKMGVTMQQYLIDVRLTRAKELVLDTEINISTIAFLCGFNDALYFSTAFKKTFGNSPVNYRILGKNNKKA